MGGIHVTSTIIASLRENGPHYYANALHLNLITLYNLFKVPLAQGIIMFGMIVHVDTQDTTVTASVLNVWHVH